jgi:hypothetical protein
MKRNLVKKLLLTPLQKKKAIQLLKSTRYGKNNYVGSKLA